LLDYLGSQAQVFTARCWVFMLSIFFWTYFSPFAILLQCVAVSQKHEYIISTSAPVIVTLNSKKHCMALYKVIGYSLWNGKCNS